MYLISEKKKQAGAELCQAQHQLWKMLLEELDLDEEKIFQSGWLSLHKIWAVL